MKLATVIGARPQFVKAAPLSRALAAHGDIREVLIHTGQHYDYEMSQIFFEELKLPEPAYHLGVGSASHGAQTGQVLARVEEVLLTERPDAVLVYGDTNSTLGGALAAAKLNVPVAHVEAGLRSFNRRMPEEINRVLTDHVSALLFAPSEVAVRNLRAEGITEGVHTVGDVMCDIAQAVGNGVQARADFLTRVGVERGRYALVTIHRPENTDEPDRLRTIFSQLARAASDGQSVVVPLHPRTQARLAPLNLSLPAAVKVIKPVSFLEMMALEAGARVIVTDSGGVQKEALFHRVPCVTVRGETEWTETVELGWNTLTDPDHLCERLVAARAGPPVTRYPYGDGRASEAIARILGAFRTS